MWEQDQVILTGDFNCKHPELGSDQTTVTQNNNLTLINDGTLTYTNVSGKEDVNDLIFISQPTIPNFRDFWMCDDRGSDHFIINGFFSFKPIYNKMNGKTVKLFHQADWIDINFAILSTMTRPHSTKWPLLRTKLTTTLTHWPTQLQVSTKSIKRNSIGLPIKIRVLIRQKRHQRRLWQRTRIP